MHILCMCQWCVHVYLLCRRNSSSDGPITTGAPPLPPPPPPLSSTSQGGVAPECTLPSPSWRLWRVGDAVLSENFETIAPTCNRHVYTHQIATMCIYTHQISERNYVHNLSTQVRSQNVTIIPEVAHKQQYLSENESGVGTNCHICLTLDQNDHQITLQHWP